MSKNKKLKLTDERSSFKPFTYPWAYDAWLKHESAHWLHSEVPMVDDVKDYKTRLTTEQKAFLTNILRFFVQGDIDVAGAYVNRYLPIFPQPETRMMLCGFAAREALHIAAYSHLIETLGLPESTYDEFMEYAEMRDKHEYIVEVMQSEKTKESIALDIATFSGFSEGMQLFSSFIMLMNFPRNGTLKGVGTIISWSMIDEEFHAESMIKLFRAYVEENREIWNDSLKSKIYAACEKMVELEDKFIDLAFGMGDMPKLSADDVKKYIRFIADRRLISMGLKGLYKVKKNPLPWVAEMIDAPQHGNFFEVRVSEYAKGQQTGSWDDVWAKDEE